MKKGNELGLQPIKTENRKGTDEIKSIHYKVNNLLYYYTKRYISLQVAKELEKALTEAGIGLNQIKDDFEPARPKAEEIQKQLREMVINLKHYIKSFKWSEADRSQIQATINYFVRQAVDKKKEGKLEEDMDNLLGEQKEIYEGMVVSSNLKGLNMSAFLDFNDELINLFEKKYKIIEK